MKRRANLRPLGDSLRALRKRAGLTQEQVALGANLDRTTVGRWERCERGIRFIQTAEGITSDGSDFAGFRARDGCETYRRSREPWCCCTPYNRYYVNYSPMWIVEKDRDNSLLAGYWRQTGRQRVPLRRSNKGIELGVPHTQAPG